MDLPSKQDSVNLTMNFYAKKFGKELHAKIVDAAHQGKSSLIFGVDRAEDVTILHANGFVRWVKAFGYDCEKVPQSLCDQTNRMEFVIGWVINDDTN